MISMLQYSVGIYLFFLAKREYEEEVHFKVFSFPKAMWWNLRKSALQITYKLSPSL